MGRTAMTMMPAYSQLLDSGRATNAQPASLRILLIEDFADARWTITEILEVMGHEVTAVEDAAAARAVQETPDVILSDIGLPDGNGCDLLVELRSRRGWEDLPALAMSGFSGPDALKRAEAAGFRQYFIKPVALTELDRALRDLAREIAE